MYAWFFQAISSGVSYKEFTIIGNKTLCNTPNFCRFDTKTSEKLTKFSDPRTSFFRT
jgi:hypothetical protein